MKKVIRRQRARQSPAEEQLATARKRKDELRRLVRAQTELRRLVRKIESERERAEVALVRLVKDVVAETGHVVLRRDELAELRNRASELQAIVDSEGSRNGQDSSQPGPATL